MKKYIGKKINKVDIKNILKKAYRLDKRKNIAKEYGITVERVRQVLIKELGIEGVAKLKERKKRLNNNRKKVKYKLKYIKDKNFREKKKEYGIKYYKDKKNEIN